MSKQIDVLLATYNGEKYLKEQLDSILASSYSNIRLIISDDCSRDDTAQILKEYAKNDSRIELYFQEQNLGVVKNIEFLLGKVKNDIYMLADQDDFWKPEKIEKSLEFLESKNLDLVFGDLEVVDENLNTINNSFVNYMKLNHKIKNSINSYELNYLYSCVTGCTIMSKKSFIDKILPLPSGTKYLLHDQWIGLITSFYGKIGFMEDAFIKYRQHNNNQLGIKMETHQMQSFEEMRSWLINVKIEMFTKYQENNNRFPLELQKLNTDALAYFQMIKNKNINFKNLKIFHRLYKNENIVFFIKSFIIMNFAFAVKFLDKLKKMISKKEC
jgi:glycosyltransferase involved in cell wall biosynthesis